METNILPFLLIHMLILCGTNSEKSQKRDDLGAKVEEGTKLLDQMSDEVKRLAKLKDVSYSLDKVGNLHINFIGTFMKVKEIGEVYEKWSKGDTEGAGKDLAEAIATLCFFDIPGMVTPALEVFNDFIMDEDDPSMKGIQTRIKKMNKKIHKIVKKPQDAMGKKINDVGKKLHQMRDYVADGLDDALKNARNQGAVTKLTKAGSAMKAFSGEAVEGIGKALTKVGGTMNALSILYAGYKFYEGVRDGTYDDAIEQGLVIAGAMVSMVATWAGAGSAFGPIGTVAGVVIGGIACLYGLLKPDPKGDLEENMQQSNNIGKKSVAYLHQDFQLLPHIVQSSVGDRVLDDWLFEANQNMMRTTIQGLTPNGPLKFNWDGVNAIERVPFSECRWWGRWHIAKNGNTRYIQSGNCVGMGETRVVDRSTYGGHTYDLEGEENFDQKRDFYGYLDETKKYTGTTIFLRTDLLKGDDKIRGINIETPAPTNLATTVGKGDDTVVLYDMRRLKSSSKININMHGGNDSVIVHGLFGDENVGNKVLVDISFSETKGSANDYGGMIGFGGMSIQENYDRLVSNIKGIEYNTNSAAHNRRNLICYMWKTGVKSCPLVISKIAMFGTSPFNDVINLENQKDMMIINEKGSNEYNFKISIGGPVISTQIIDKNLDPSTLRMKAPFGIKVVYIEKEETFEVYISEQGVILLRQRIIYKGSKNKPVIFVPDRTSGSTGEGFLKTEFSDLIRGRVKLTSRLRYETITDAYKFNSNAQVSGNDPKSICLCPLPQKNQGYWTVKMGNNIDQVIVSQIFIDEIESRGLTAKLVSDKVRKVGGEYQDGWILQIREKDDIYRVAFPRYDVSLQGAEVVVSDTGHVLFDLTDPSPLTNEVDLVNKYKNVETFTLVDRLAGEEDAEYVYIEPGDGQNFVNLNLGTGTNTVVFDVSSADSSLKYQIAKIDIGEGAYYHFMTIIKGSKVSMIYNADRFVCQFTGGLQRDLPAFNRAENSGERSLLDDCNDIDLGQYTSLDTTAVVNAPECDEKCGA